MVFCIFRLYTEDEGNVVPILMDITSTIEKAKEIIQIYVEHDVIKKPAHPSMNSDNNYTFIGKRDECSDSSWGGFKSCNGYVIEDVEVKS